MFRFAYIVIGSLKRQPAQIAEAYRLRFGIETSYRLINTVRACTTCKIAAVCLLLVALAFLWLNLWQSIKWLYLFGPKPGPRVVLHHLLPLARWRFWLWQMVKQLAQKKRPTNGRFLYILFLFHPFQGGTHKDNLPDQFNARRCKYNQEAHTLCTISIRSSARPSVHSVLSFVLQQHSSQSYYSPYPQWYSLLLVCMVKFQGISCENPVKIFVDCQS